MSQSGQQTVRIISENGRPFDTKVYDTNTGAPLHEQMKIAHLAIEIDPRKDVINATLFCEQPLIDLVANAAIQTTRTIRFDPTDRDQIQIIIDELRAILER